MTKSAPTTATSILLKEVLGSWSSQTITYNNAPALSDKALDYQYMSANSIWYAVEKSMNVGYGLIILYIDWLILMALLNM